MEEEIQNEIAKVIMSLPTMKCTICHRQAKLTIGKGYYQEVLEMSTKEDWIKLQQQKAEAESAKTDGYYKKENQNGKENARKRNGRG